jgi:hypothetical protein
MSEPTPEPSNNPSLKQHSGGANSPNVFGNHNVININTNEQKLDEITGLLKTLKANPISRDKLMAKYPIGYVIFELDYQNQVWPYQGQFIRDQYELNWSVVRYTVNTPDRIEIRLPDITRNGAGVVNARTSGLRRVGNLAGGVGMGQLGVFAEILAIGEKGIVFLVGLVEKPQRPRRPNPANQT